MLSSLSWTDLSSHNNCSDPEEKEICPHKGPADEPPTFPSTKTSTTTKPPSLVTTKQSTLSTSTEIPPVTDPVIGNQESTWIAVIIATASLIVILLLLIGHLIRKMMLQSRLKKLNKQNPRRFSETDHNTGRDDLISNRNSRGDDVHEVSETESFQEIMRTSCLGQSSTNLDNAHQENDANNATIENIRGPLTNGAGRSNPLDATRVKEIAMSEENRQNNSAENEYESIKTQNSEERNQNTNRMQAQQQQPMIHSVLQQHPGSIPVFSTSLVQHQQLVPVSYMFATSPVTAPLSIPDAMNYIPSSPTALPQSPGPTIAPGYSNYNPL